MPVRASKRDVRWPKQVPQLTDDERRIQDDWMRYYHEHLPDDYARVLRFNHEYAARSASPGRTLEIGAGLGEHLHYEDLPAQEYHAVELREEMAEAITREFPSVITVVGDCQQRLAFEDASFDRVIAIHVLEHLPNLPAALSEIDRLLKPDGVFSVVIPCEGGIGYGLGRRVTTQRAFEKRYKTGFKRYLDHVNRAREILTELRARFDVADSTYWPARVPLVDFNVLIGLTCVPKTR